MGLFNRAKSAQHERRNLSLYVGGLKLSDILNKDNPTVIFCENLIANTIATLPFYLYRRVGKNIYEAFDHPCYKLITKRPNLNEPPSVFFASLVKQILKGNAYIQKIYNKGGISQLVILDGRKVTVETDGLVKKYFYGGKEIPNSEIIHIPSNYGYNGVTGKAVIEFAQSTIQASDILNLYTKNFYQNMVFSKLKVSLNKSNYKDLTDEKIRSIADLYTASMSEENIGKPVVEFDDIEVTPFDLKSSATDEHIKARAYLDRLICQVYGVPYSLLEESNKYNSYEQFNLFFRSHTLTQYTDRIEQYLTMGLLTEEEQERLFFKCDYSELLTPDSEAKNKLTIENFKNGILTLNEARAELGLPPAEGQVTGNTHIMNGFGVLTDDVINAWAAGAKTKQAELDNTDNKGK